MTWRPIPLNGLYPQPWRNGLGTSREIAAGRGWSVGLAELEQDAPFSDYPGMDRIFTPIQGDPPPELAFAGGPFTPCPLLIPFAFPGDVPTLSRIPARGRAFNVIVARDHWRAAVEIRRTAAGQAVAPVPADIALLHVIEGGLTDGSGPGDSLLGPGPPVVAARDSLIAVVTLTGWTLPADRERPAQTPGLRNDR